MRYVQSLCLPQASGDVKFLRVNEAASSGEWSGEQGRPWHQLSNRQYCADISSVNIFSSLFPSPSGHPSLLALGQAFQIHHEVTQRDKSSLRLTGFRLLDGLGPGVVCCFASPLCQTSLKQMLSCRHKSLFNALLHTCMTETEGTL